jgi:TCP-1/cpn60 chaperonin family
VNRAAVEEGIVPGGGVASLYAAKALDGLTPENNDQKVGIDIVRRALQSPVRQVVENARADGSIVVGKLLDANDPNRGFDAQTGDYVDMASSTRPKSCGWHYRTASVAQHAHHTQLRVNGNPVHRREVDDNAVIAQRPAGDVVAAAFDPDDKMVRTREFHRANDVSRSRTAGDQTWMFIDARIPNTPS